MHRSVSVRVVVVAAITLAGALSLSGCVDQQDVLALREDAAELRDELALDHARTESRLEALPANHPQRSAAESAAALSLARLEALDASLTTLDAALLESQQPTDPLTALLGELAPWLPAPARVPLVLGSALAATVLRGHQFKKGLVSVAQSIHKARSADPEFNDRFKRNAAAIRAAQTPTAARVVQKVKHQA